MDEIARSPIGVEIKGVPRGQDRAHGGSLERLIADLLPDDKVAAVRIYREATGAGLAQAMSAVKAIAEKHGKDKPVPAITSELIFRCLLGAAGFIVGGFWLAQTQTWGPNQFMFRVGGLLLAIFWVSQNYTAHLRKSRWQLADLEDTAPRKKPAPEGADIRGTLATHVLPWFYELGRTLRWLAGRLAFLVRREWQWLRGQAPSAPPPYPEGETKVSSNVPRLTLGSLVAGILTLFRWLLGRLFFVVQLPWKILRRAWWIFPLAWTGLCVVVFVGVWRPGGDVDFFYWPYQGMSESNVVLRPTAKNIERIVVSQRRASRIQGSTNIGKLQSDIDKELLIRDDYEIMVTPAKRANNFSLEADGLNRLAWHFEDVRGAEHQGDLPLDLRTMVEFLSSCGVDWSGADVNEVAKPLLDIILLSFTTEQVGGMWLGNQRQPGRLETIVANQERNYQQQMKDYPFSEHIGTAIFKTGPVVSILWVGVPVTLTLWAIGMLWLRRRRRARQFV